MNTVKYLELKPDQFLQRITELPLAYLPLGTLEWHGTHLPLGSDALQSEALFLELAQECGGVVLPPLFLGPDRKKITDDGLELIGMDYAASTNPQQQLPGSAYWISNEQFEQLLYSILLQLKRAGFKAVMADGHGPSRRLWANKCEAWEKEFELKLFGIKDEQRPVWNFMNDHAAQNETSIMLHYYPNLVDLSVYPNNENTTVLGVNGVHPSLATAELGKLLSISAKKYAKNWINNLKF